MEQKARPISHKVLDLSGWNLVGVIFVKWPSTPEKMVVVAAVSQTYETDMFQAFSGNILPYLWGSSEHKFIMWVFVLQEVGYFPTLHLII